MQPAQRETSNEPKRDEAGWCNVRAGSAMTDPEDDDLYSTKMDLPTDFASALRLPDKTGPIATLHIFDFDQTLIRTPNPDEGKEAYLTATGTRWKGGWWGRAESLSPPVLPSPVPDARIIRTTFSEMMEVVHLSQTAVGVVVTGRISKLRAQVLRILDEATAALPPMSTGAANPTVPHGAVFTHPGGGYQTIEFKKRLIYSIVASGPLAEHPVKDVHIWEDRRPHAEIFATSFAATMKEKTGVDVVVHFVPPEMP